MEKQEGRDPAAARIDDPWYDALASGWGELDGEPASATVPAQQRADEDEDRRLTPAEIYLEVQRSAAFQEVRRRYRRFVVPAVAAFFAWYLAYVVTAVSAPGLMSRPVAGAVNVAMVAGLAQFLSTFLLTWAYARHARLHRDRAALELRWVVFEQNRRPGPAGRTARTDHPGRNARDDRGGHAVRAGHPAPLHPTGQSAPAHYPAPPAGPPVPEPDGRPEQEQQRERAVEQGRAARRNDGQGTTQGANR